MPKCQFTTKYHDIEIEEGVDFLCPELPLVSGRCIFHDNDYLQDRTNNEEHKRAVLDRFKRKVNHAISNNEQLLCIGFHLPDFSLKLTKFTKPVYFSDSKFFGKVDFSEAEFEGGANFGLTNFLKEANFSDAEFKGKANFSGAKFNDIADFQYTKFNDKVDFSGAKFNDKANFPYLIFNDKANFSDAEFKGKADFTITEFQEARFISCKFQEAIFHGTGFQQANFSNTKFENADYYGARFQEAIFYQTVFTGEANFESVLFKNEESVLFGVDDLSKVSFMNTDVTRIRFSKNVVWGKKDSFKVVDEEKLEERINNNYKKIVGEEKVRLGGIITIYRNLRENYEYSLRYEEADKFFEREMEVKRLYREKILEKANTYTYIIHRNGWFRKNFSLTGLYYNISEYGQNYKRPALLAVFFVSLPILYALGQTILSNENITPDTIANTTTTSLSNIFKIKDQDIVGYFINIATIPILGTLFVAALKRTFEKKFRH